MGKLCFGIKVVQKSVCFKSKVVQKNVMFLQKVVQKSVNNEEMIDYNLLIE